ncbi:MAG: hypothetical protein RSC49_08740, partial [Clostridium sp.]
STKIPQGIFGLILAALLAATMSSIDSLLNSMSTVFVKDIYEPYRRNKDKNKDFNANLSISRWITFVFAIFIFIFTYFGLSASTSPLVTMMGEYCSYITGSILGVFILAMFTNKANEKGTILGFISGILITILVAKATAINWGWYNLIGISITILVGYVISILSGGNKKDISGQTFMSMRENMIKLGKIKEDGMYIIPGKFDKSSYILVGIFIIQFLILGILQYM